MCDTWKISPGSGDGRYRKIKPYEAISSKDHSYGRITPAGRRSIEIWEDRYATFRI